MDTKVRIGRVAFGIAALGFLVETGELRALDNGLARTPPMGWNSWNKFSCNVSEDLIKQAADAIVSSGMKDAGYQYVVIDDCWQVDRDAEGNIVPDAKHFPSGIKALADYVHAKGLKFGMYSDRDIRHLPPFEPLRTAHQAGSGDGTSLAVLRGDGDSESGHGRLRESAQHRADGGKPDAGGAERAAEGDRFADQLQPLRHRIGRPAETVCLLAGQRPGGYGEWCDGERS